MTARPSPHTLGNRAARAAWGVVWRVLFRPSPRPLHAWRCWLLRCFGAKIGRGAVVHASVRIWAPWNLAIGNYSCLGPDVDCYCVDRIVLGDRVTVSQYSFLCTASHDFDDPRMPLVTAPISIGDDAWVCADVFLAPGVVVEEGAVVGARASAFRDVPAWTVVVGNPARPLRQRNRSAFRPGSRLEPQA